MSQSAQLGTDEASRSPERVAVLGSGTIACGLAECAAESGFEVTVWARSAESADRARASLSEVRAAVTTELSDLSAATLAVEAIVEEAGPKMKLLRSLGELLPEASLLATTTSALSISELALASGRSSRFFGLHVFNPVTKMALVELSFPPGCEDETRRRAHAFCDAIGKRAVEVPDETGFVVNRLLFPYLFDAVRLLERTGMEPAAIDVCMKDGASHPMGPLELLDFVGLDVAESIGDALYAETGEQGHSPPGRITALVAAGKLGRKSGAGFYEYE
jgi:3-hydroxybutyryl-CoA dehydrogenase